MAPLRLHGSAAKLFVFCVVACMATPALSQFGRPQKPKPSRLTLSVPGQLDVIDDGNTNPLLLSAVAVSQLPIPPNVERLQLEWSAAPDTTYRLETASSDSSRAQPIQFDIPFNGTVPTTVSPITLNFPCDADGVSTLNATFFLSGNSSVNGTMTPYEHNTTFYVAKQCGASNAACAACGPCIAGGTCSCEYKDSGSTCFRGPTPVEKDSSDGIVSAVDSKVRVLSWNVWGVGLSETSTELLDRTRAIGRTIASASPRYDVVALQEVWSESMRQTLVDALQATFPYFARQAFGNGPSQESGLLIASRFPIEVLAFEEFRTSIAGTTDALSDKGVLGALLRVDDDDHLFMFDTHMNAPAGGDARAVRSAQMAQARQIRQFVDTQVKSAARDRAASSIGVMLVGDMNVRNDDSGATLYTDMLKALGNEGAVREMYDVAHPEGLPTYAAVGLGDFVNNFGNRTGVTAASTMTRVDFGFAIDSVDDIGLRKLDIDEAFIRAFRTTDGSTTVLDGLLSDHIALEFYVAVDSTDSTALAVGITVLVLVVAIIAALTYRVKVQKKPLPLPPLARVCLRQTKLMMKKNYLMNIRNRRALIIQLLVPGAFVFLLFVLQFALLANQARSETRTVRRYSESNPIPSIPRCVVGKNNGHSSCFTFAYAPQGDAVVDALMEQVRIDSNIPASEVQSFASSTDADKWFSENGNKTQGAYHLTPQYDSTGAFAGLNYTIQYNTTLYVVRSVRVEPLEYVFLPMQNAIDRAAIKYLTSDGGATPSSTVDMQGGTILMPHPQLRPVDVIGQQGPAFFLGALMFSFVIQLGQLVTEKEMHLREALTTHGMWNSVYWLTWLMTNVTVNITCAVLLVIFGAIFQFKFFLLNDFGTYFVLFLLFGLAMTPLAFLFSIFLSHARTATSLGFGVYLLGVILQGGVRLIFTEDVDEEYQVMFALLPFTMLAKGMADLGTASSSEDSVGIRWADRSSNAFWSLQKTYNWLIADFFIFLVLAIFLDYTIVDAQGESRVARGLAKLCGGIPREVEDSAEAAEAADGAAAVAKQQRDRIGAGPGKGTTALSIEGLRKVYATFRKGGCIPDSSRAFTAVDKMFLHVEDKQLFCLLGHNGAGKSTTLSMLTGLLEPTSGKVAVFGHELRDINSIRAIEGVCPQHDVLWADMTAREHIEMFAGLKGVPEDLVEAEVQSRLGDVELYSVRDGLAGSFSGGMQRRLSVAVALTADPKVVYLDEPTTGMDPVSRRQVWNLLEREKRKRLVILTTHSMEEADVLSDTVAIMRRGRIQCLGAPVTLKNRYGSGFKLTVVCDHTNDSDSVTLESASKDDTETDTRPAMERAKEAVARVAPYAKLERSGVGVLEYALPRELPEGQTLTTGDAKEGATTAPSGVSLLPHTLNAIAEQSRDAGIVDVQVGLTSLEDVFLAVTGAGRIDGSGNEVVAAEGEDAETKEADAGKGNKVANGVGVSVDPKTTTSAARRKQTLDFSVWSQFRALSAKSTLVQARRLKSNSFQIILPAVLVLMLFSLQVLVDNFLKDRLGDFIPGMLHPPTIPAPWFTPGSEYDPLDCPQGNLASFGIGDVLVDNVAGELLYGIEPSAAAIAAAGGSRASAIETIKAQLGDYGAPAPVDAAQFWSALSDTAPPSGLLGNTTHDVLQMISVQGVRFGGGQFCFSRPFVQPLTWTYKGDQRALDEDMFSRFGQRSHAAGYVFEDLSGLSGGNTIKYSIMYNRTLTNGREMPRANSVITGGVFKALGGSKDLTLDGGRSMPIKDTPVTFDLVSLIGPTFYIFLFQLIFPVALATLVYEKHYKLREVMKMMGLRTSVYFASNYLVFFVMFAIATFAWIGLAMLLDFRIFTVNSFGITFVLTLLFGNTQIASAFVASVFFQRSRTATVAGYVYIFTAGILALALIRLYVEDPETTDVSMFFIQLVPPFALYRALFEMRLGVQFDGVGLTWADLSSPDVNIAEPMWFLLVEWLFLCVLAVYLEMVVPSTVGVKQHPLFCCKRSYWEHRKRVAERRKALREGLAAAMRDESGVEARKAGRAEAVAYSEAHGEPADVAEERAAVWLEGRQDDMIRVLSASKHYPVHGSSEPNIAVDHLSLGIREGECFGLLGPNGSGKTTTINMLCGYFEPTEGTATVCGMDIRDDMDLIHLVMGVCPQENVLWEELSAADHLRFFGQLKDLHGEELEEEVRMRLADVELLDVANKAAGKFSGGMKRRLCVAMALVGSPQIVLLDEPTTGLDPAARRQLWSIIDKATRHSAILLTTHSMQEAEALCSRVGMFVRGSMRAIGSPARLKASLGEFYKMTLICEDSAVDSAVAGFVSANCPGASLITAPLGGSRNYQVPKSETDLPKLVDVLDKEAAGLNIADWAVCNITLEEVFLKISEQDPVIGKRLREENAAQAALAAAAEAGTSTGAGAGAAVGGTVGEGAGKRRASEDHGSVASNGSGSRKVVPAE